MEQRWGFLSKWWSALHGPILYKKIERLDDAWAEHKFQLQVELPKRYESSSYRQGFVLNDEDEAEFRLRMQRVREALALLAAVAHVDPKGWKHLLREKCRVKMGKKGEEKYEKEVPVEFVLKFDLNENKKTRGDESLGLGLLLFFDTSHRTEPSRDYVRALAKIAKMDESLKPGQPGVNIEVPVRLHYSQDTKKEALKLENIATAEKVILERWSSLEQEPVTAKTLRCTIVLQPMIALCDYGGCDAKTVKTIQTLLADNVWFLQLDLYPDRADDAAGMKRLALLMTRVFKGASSSGTVRNPTYHIETGVSGEESQLRQLQTLNLQCDVEMGAWEFGSVLSAVALNDTTKNLWIRFYTNDKISLSKWMWLAYGVFSKRACGVESLTITEIDSMSVADIDALSSVLLSDHPEEVLAGFSGDHGIERRATLKSGARVRWDIDDEGQMRRGSRPLALSFEMYSVWTFADDGQTEWVNVVIPGFGHCQVRRNDLAFQEEYDQQMPVNKLASLTICFDKFKEERDEADNGDDDDDRDDSNRDDIEAEAPNNEDGAKTSFQTDGLAHFLERVGSSLQILSLDGPWEEIDENLILQHCPNLEKLSLCGGLVDVQLCFSEYRARNQPVPQLDCHWHDVFALSADLSDPANPLHKCVHQLRVRLKDAWEGWSIVQGSYNPPGFKSRADELLKMLDKNQSLEYCEVIAPIEHKDYAKQFSKHHLQLIKRCIQPFRLGMIGFLSVISSLQASSQEKKKRKSTSPEAGRALCDLNQHVLSNIFQFAADRVIRQVYFYFQDGLDWDSETEGFLIV